MGKKKKQRKKITKWIEADDGIEFDDLVYAGLGVLAASAKKGKKRKFKKARKRGRKLVAREIGALTQMLAPDEEPLISYTHHGGGWFGVEVDGFVVDRIQGEEEAAIRAGELLEAYAALDLADRDPDRTGLYDNGGGWYGIYVNGVPIDNVQGREEAELRFEEIESLR